MLFSRMIIDICKIVCANIFPAGTKKNYWGIQLLSTNLSMTIVYPNILYNIGEDLSMPIADVNDGHVHSKFLCRVMETITITK